VLIGAQNRKNINTKLWNQYRQYYPEIVSSLVITYRKLEMVEEAKALLSSWLEKNPKDKEANKLLKELENSEG